MRWEQYKYPYNPPKDMLDYFLEHRIPLVFMNPFLRRGIKSSEGVNVFLNATLQDTTSSIEFGEEMLKAITQLAKVIETRKKILIYGNEDYGGIMGTVIILETLTRLQRHYGFELDYMIPNRYQEGREISKRNFKRIISKKPHLVITVDCGISSGYQINLLRKKGIETIVIDNQDLKSEFPHYAHAILNSSTCNYPNKGLSSSAVVYQFMKGLWEINNKRVPTWVEQNLLDLVAIGTVSTNKPILWDNRIYLKEGLHLIKSGKRPVFRYLNARLKGQLDSIHTIKTEILPIINISGKKGLAQKVINLFLSKDVEHVDKILDELEALNQQRNRTVKDVMDGVSNQLQSSPYNFITVVKHDQLDESDLTIFADEIMQIHYRPTFVLSRTKSGLIKGTAKSIEGIHLVNLIQPFEWFLTNWEGDKDKVDFSLPPTPDYASFFSALDSQLSEYPTELWVRTKYWENSLHSDDLTPSFFQTMGLLEPYGKDFEQIIWRIQGQLLAGTEIVGDEKIGKMRLGGKTFPYSMHNKINVHFEEPNTFFGIWEYSIFHHSMQFKILDVENKDIRELIRKKNDLYL